MSGEFRALCGAFLAWLALAGAGYAQGPSPRPDRPPAVAGRFDYYLLALSWSPSFCADPAMARREQSQCAAERPFAFVVHGLWPQYERGWPADCRLPGQPADVPPALQTRMLDLMPSPRLVQQQWDKHGTCAGLSQAAYFDTLRRFRAGIAIPPAYGGLSQPLTVTAAQVEQAFLKANPMLRTDMLVVTCDERRIREVRICLTKEGRPRACGQDVRERCGAAPRVLPPVRRGAAR